MAAGGDGGALVKPEELQPIRVDGNEMQDRNTWLLHLEMSVEDLERIPGGPKEGLKVKLIDYGGSDTQRVDYELEAVLEYSNHLSCWLGVMEEGTLEHGEVR